MGGAQPRWEGQGARYLQLPPLIGFKCGTADGGGSGAAGFCGALSGSSAGGDVCPLLVFEPHVCGLQRCTGSGCAQYHLFPLKCEASCSLHAELWAPSLGPAALSPPPALSSHGSKGCSVQSALWLPWQRWDAKPLLKTPNKQTLPSTRPKAPFSPCFPHFFSSGAR